jgi:hypothetical protein
MTYNPLRDLHPPGRDVTTATPWGKADFAYTYARGIISYSCPGHGGFHLSKTRNDRVHSAWRRADGWYEEDVEWAVVALTFPEHFHRDIVRAAQETAKSWLPHEYMAVRRCKLTLEESHVLRREAFDREHARDYVSVAAYGDWADWVPDGKVGVFATVGGRRNIGATEHGRYFLVDAARYAERGHREFAYVVDLETDISTRGAA